MAYKTTGYQFSPRITEGSPGPLADMPRVQDVVVPESQLRFGALSAPVVFPDRREAVAEAIAGAISDVGKGIITGYLTKREEDLALEKEERDQQRKIELELMRQQRYEEAENRRDERLRKTIQARLDQVGATKAEKSIRYLDEAEDIDNLDDDVEVDEEGLPGEPTIYDEQGRARVEPLLPEETEDIPMEGGPVRAPINPPLVPDEELETQDLPPLGAMAPYGFENINAIGGALPQSAQPNLAAIPPEYMAAQAGGVPPAAPLSQLPLQDIGLSLDAVDVGYVTPEMDRQMKELSGGVRKSLANALLEQAARAQTGQPLAEVEPPTTGGAKALPKSFKPGPYRSYQKAFEMAQTPMPEGFAPPEVNTKIDPDTGETYYVVEAPKRLTPKEEKAVEGEGGKPLTSTEAKTLGDFDSVSYTLDVIEDKLNKIKQRGPIVGQVRGRVPYDVDAQEIENLVTSIVPGLARGVFGEVGVLTDTDVARYKALIPNIRTDARVAERAFINLRNKIAASKKSKLEALRDSGYDVSGFSEQLKQLQERQEETTGSINEQVRSLAAQLMSMQKGTPEYEESWNKLIELRKRQRAAEDKGL